MAAVMRAELGDEVTEEQALEWGYRYNVQTLQDDLARIGVHFDTWFSERTLHEGGNVKRVLEDLRARGVVFEADGATWLRSTDFGDPRDRVLVKSLQLLDFRNYVSATLEFEPGITTADVKALFDVIRPRQVALIQAIAARPQVDDAFLRGAYDEREMWAFGEEVITAFGFDWTRGRQDKSVHPFATGIGPDDVRITTRSVPHEPLSLFFGAAHETGHALYEQGIAGAFRRSLLGDGASLGIHESQSRLWENLVARSWPFWQHFFPRLQQRFPAQLGTVTAAQFHRGINKVQRSLIRVESDEATYNLHIMLRVEMEIAMLSGDVAAKDLPDLWNTRVQEYLGLRPDSDARGILQDIHWSIGAMGYFATYTLGNLISAQLWNAFGRANPDRDLQLARGEFAPLLAWLRTNVHQYGRKFKPQELVERVTGSRIDPEPYLQYLETKYGGIYGLH